MRQLPSHPNKPNPEENKFNFNFNKADYVEMLNDKNFIDFFYV